MKRFLQISISLFSFCLLQSKLMAQNPDRKTVISVIFSGINEIRYNYLDEQKVSTNLHYRNPTRGDTVVTKYLKIDRPTHIFFANAEFVPETKKFINTRGSLLILPGDSISLGQNGFRVIHADHWRGFIDSLVNLEDLYNVNQNKVKQSIAGKGLAGTLVDIHAQYKSNENKIALYSRQHHDDSNFTKALKDLNYLTKARAICRIPAAEQIKFPAGKRMMDSCFREIQNNMERVEKVNSPFSFSVLYYLVTYNALVAGKNTTYFWNYFTSVSPQILNSEFYRSFLLNRLYLNYDGNTEKLESLISGIKKAGIVDHRYDSVLQAKIELHSNTDDQMASELKNKNGVYLNYFDLLRSLKGNYVFIDFWASWCGPCRMQMPFLGKLKPEFKERVKFISISIDENDKEEDWIAVSRSEGLYDDPYSFRLEKGSYNKLLKILEFEAVPRYLLYAPDGKLLSSEFTTPEKSHFRQDLLNAISR